MNLLSPIPELSKTTSEETRPRMMLSVSKSGKRGNSCAERMNNSKSSTFKSNRRRNKLVWKKKPKKLENKSLMKSGGNSC